MPFRLAKEESFSDGIRRVVLEQLNTAADLLSNPKKVDRSVHETRKSIKKVRSILRLIQPEMRSAWRAENGQLRTLGRKLSSLRDDAVLPQVFNTLRPKRGNRFDAIERSLEAKQERPVTELFQDTMAGLRATARRAEDWPIPNDVNAVLACGFEDTYQRGKKALSKVLEDPDPENLHQFRKRVKEHRFHLSLLLSSPRDTERVKALRNLEALLGDDHNLTVLRERLEQNPALGEQQNVNAFLMLLTRKQQQLEARALPLGRRLYAPEKLHN